ncbi:MAG: DUF559 domain-containing protein [Deltaproteobacteria bacterium]|nr:DUF559 domain-containing protein [Deltaproteobacteria bacterium]
MLRLCESPVEQILLATLCEYWHAEVHPQLKRLQCHFSADNPECDGIFRVCCEPQKTITTWSDQRYRVDIYLYLTRFQHSDGSNTDEVWPELARLVVEVDGHEFHDRTKHQASRDRKRDRELMFNGYPTIRFTGTDVFNDPMLCAEDINLQVNELANTILQDYIDRGKLEELIVG